MGFVLGLRYGELKGCEICNACRVQIAAAVSLVFAPLFWLQLTSLITDSGGQFAQVRVADLGGDKCKRVWAIRGHSASTRRFTESRPGVLCTRS